MQQPAFSVSRKTIKNIAAAQRRLLLVLLAQLAIIPLFILAERSENLVLDLVCYAAALPLAVLCVLAIFRMGPRWSTRSPCA